MANFKTKKSFLTASTFKNSPNKKILITLGVLFIFRFGNAIPISGIDQESLKKVFSNPANNSGLLQLVNMYSGSGGSQTILSSFSLGIIPFINASILIDLLTTLIPSFEKLQSEEGEFGRRQLLFYKKLLTFFLSIIQSIFLIVYLKPYFYFSDFYHFGLFVLQLVTGAMVITWMTSVIDNKGVGNGSSILIFANILLTFISKNYWSFETINKSFLLEFLFLLLLSFLICLLQVSRVSIKLVSARQLAYLEKINTKGLVEKEMEDFQMKNSKLSIKLNQAGIFPIIIASNLVPFISYFSQSILGIRLEKINIVSSLIYYSLIIGFNYFYTIIFWDPEKISEQLRKSSVSLVDVSPGADTVLALNRMARSSSLSGGVFLAFVLILYDIAKQTLKGSLLNQINISSLIILIGVAYEIQKTIRSLYKTSV